MTASIWRYQAVYGRRYAEPLKAGLIAYLRGESAPLGR